MLKAHRKRLCYLALLQDIKPLVFNVIGQVQNHYKALRLRLMTTSGARGLLQKAEAGESSSLEWKLDRELFYENGDGQMKLAEAGFASQANGQPSIAQVGSVEEATKALNSWARWISSNLATHESYVDVVWQGLFNGRLESSNSQETEFSELSELRSFLAAINRDNNLTLRELIEVLVSSDAFTSPIAEPTQSWYLMASKENVDQLRKQMRTFALYPPKSDASVLASEQLLAWLSQMNQPAPLVLAQPRQEPLKDRVAPLRKRVRISASRSWTGSFVLSILQTLTKTGSTTSLNPI